MASTIQLAARRNVLSSFSQRRGLRDTISGYLFLAPFFVLYCLLKLWPIVNGFWISLHRWDTIGTNIAFIGLGNYQRILQDRLFWDAVRHTLLFTVISTPVLIFGGLCLALILNRPLFSGGVFRTLYYLPNVLSTSVVGLIFLAVFGASEAGVFNTFLRYFGISPIPFLLDSDWAMPSIAFAALWWTVGFNMLILLAGLQSIPDEVNDAAKVDGAGERQRFWYITLPLLRRQLLLVTILQVISSFQVFGLVDVMTKGGPGGQTRSIVYYIFERSFQQNQLGYGSAIAFILFAVLFVLSITQLRLFSREEDVL
ncbi:MAG: sugar ABC transporter permease [Anaerolineae bacterium]|nr:sugar ABC transporter permease [Anaerolineae bacterium]